MKNILIFGQLAVILVIWYKYVRAKLKIMEMDYEIFNNRNDAVRWFRSWVAARMGDEAHDQLPSYDEMMKSDKRINEDNFIKND